MLTALVLLCSIGTTDCRNIAEALTMPNRSSRRATKTVCDLPLFTHLIAADRGSKNNNEEVRQITMIAKEEPSIQINLCSTDLVMRSTLVFDAVSF